MKRPRTSRSALALAVLSFSLLFISGGRGGDRYLVGAHYYVWYPSNFADGYLRGALAPRQRPTLGEYDSRSPAIAERQIALAVSHGIDFFTVDWWPKRPVQNGAIASGLLRASNIGDIRFCIFYETSELGGGEDGSRVVFDATTKDRIVSDMVAIARR